MELLTQVFDEQTANGRKGCKLMASVLPTQEGSHSENGIEITFSVRALKNRDDETPDRVVPSREVNALVESLGLVPAVEIKLQPKSMGCALKISVGAEASLDDAITLVAQAIWDIHNQRYPAAEFPNCQIVKIRPTERV